MKKPTDLTTTLAPPPNKKTSKKMTSLSLGVSIIFHFIVFLFVGTVVITEHPRPPLSSFPEGLGFVDDELVMDDSPFSPIIPDEPLPEPVEPAVASFQVDIPIETHSTRIDMIPGPVQFTTIQNNDLSGASMPISSIQSPVGIRKILSDITKTTAPPTIILFDTPIEAKKFGAVLDISFSAHGTIDGALNEIKNGFPDAVLVLAPGCGMRPAEKGMVVLGQKFEDEIEDYYFQQQRVKDRQVNAASFFDHLLSTNRNFKRLWNRSSRDGLANVLYLELPTKLAKDKKGELKVPARISGTQHAIEFLINENCDVIYWMADFNDSIDPQVAEKLAKKMKRKGIKLIQHDFDGEGTRDAKNRKVMQEMLDATSGMQIVAM